METIGKQKLWSFLARSAECRITTNTKIRTGAGHKVATYLELAQKIAELQFRNRDHVLLFRGQGGEEIVIAVSPAPDGNGTRVTGSSYLFDMQISRFFATLPPVTAP